MLPAAFQAFGGDRKGFTLLTGRVTAFHFFFSTFIVITSAFLYSKIVFDPQKLKALLNRYGFSQQKDEEPLSKSILKVLAVTSIILFSFHMIPYLVISYAKIPYNISNLFFGSIALIGVGVLSDIFHQVDFFKEKDSSGFADWSVCYRPLMRTKRQ